MKKRIIKNVFGLLAIILFIGFNFNGKNAVADGDDITCRCAIFRKGCFANGWGTSCAPEGTTTCWTYDRNCTPDPE